MSLFLNLSVFSFTCRGCTMWGVGEELKPGQSDHFFITPKLSKLFISCETQRFWCGGM